jgi:hypothetical protein
LYVAAALLSSAGGSLIMQRFDGLIQPTQRMTELYSVTQLSPSEADELRILERTRSCKNVSLVLGLTGLLFASCLGISEGLVEESFPACVFGLVAGAGLGSLGGAGGGCLSVYVDDWVQHRVANDLVRNMLTHTSSWIVISAAAALAILIATRRARFAQCLQFVITAMSAAMICGALFGLVSAILFPEVETGQPLPQGDANRILWLLATTLMVSIAAARSRPRPAD